MTATMVPAAASSARAGERTAAVERAVRQLQSGRCAVLYDDRDPGGQGYLVLAGQKASAAAVSFVTRHSSGFLCMALTDDDADRLDLPVLRHVNQTRSKVRFGVSVDARVGVSTGISAADRARTIGLLSGPDSMATDFTRPGHLVTIRAASGGVMDNACYAEGATDLARLADLRPAAALAAIVSADDPARMANCVELTTFAQQYRLPLLTLGDLVQYRSRTGRHVSRAAQAQVPIGDALFSAVGYRSHHDAREHVAFVLGDIAADSETIVRIQQECVIGDVFGSRRCGCRDELDAALSAVAAVGRGVVVYLRERGGTDGMLRTLAQYRDAHAAAPVGPSSTAIDPRDAVLAVQILKDLGVRRVNLLSSDRDEPDLESYGLSVTSRTAICSVDDKSSVNRRGRRSG